jgi:4-amino-4-deoxy-L-arabinose transferase-like glycosyltransferase
MQNTTSAVLERRTDLAWASAIFLVALVLRVAFVAWIDPSPAEGGVTDDTWFYHNSAEALRDGRGLTVPGRAGAPTAQFPPGYPGMLASVYLLPGPDVDAGKALNVVLGATAAVLLFCMGGMLWSRTVGIVAGLLCAFYPSLVFSATLLLSGVAHATLLLAVMCAFIWALKRKISVVVVAGSLGLALGATSLIRGEGLLLPFAFATVWLWLQASWRETAKFLLVTYVAMAAVLGAWTVRNVIEMDAPILISTGSTRMAQAHWSGADGGSNDERVRELNALYPDVPYPEREVKISRYSMEQGLRYMRTHRLHELSLFPRRLYFLYRNDHYASDLFYRRPDAPSGATLERLSTVADAYYYVTIAWAALGLVLWWRHYRGLALLFLGQVAALSLLVGVLYAGVERYHLQLLPLLCLIAAPTIVHAVDLARGGAGLPVEEP